MWKQIEGGKWRLHDRLGDNERHECPALPHRQPAPIALVRQHNRGLRDLVEDLESGRLLIEHLSPVRIEKLRALLAPPREPCTDPAWMEPPAGYHWRDE